VQQEGNRSDRRQKQQSNPFRHKSKHLEGVEQSTYPQTLHCERKLIQGIEERENGLGKISGMILEENTGQIAQKCGCTRDRRLGLGHCGWRFERRKRT